MTAVGTRYRLDGLIRNNAIVGSIAMAVYFGTTIPVMVDGGVLTGTDLAIFRIVVTCGGVAFAWLFIRLVRLCALVTADALVVRNPLRTYTLEWQELAEVRLGSDLRHASIGIAELKNGDSVSISAIRGNKGVLLNDEEDALGMIKQIERERVRQVALS